MSRGWGAVTEKERSVVGRRKRGGRPMHETERERERGGAGWSAVGRVAVDGTRPLWWRGSRCAEPRASCPCSAVMRGHGRRGRDSQTAERERERRLEVRVAGVATREPARVGGPWKPPASSIWRGPSKEQSTMRTHNHVERRAQGWPGCGEEAQRVQSRTGRRG